MIQKELLYAVARDQRRELEPVKGTVPRELAKKIRVENAGVACIVKGVRRCGKSTLLKQLLLGNFGQGFFYVNFDDERLFGFEAGDFQKLMEVFIEIWGNQKVLLLDEVQNITGWELYANRMLREGYFVFITGSNAELLSRELGTHLTGRHVDYELYPFSLGEFLAMRGAGALQRRKALGTQDRAKASSLFKEYLENGGMPECLISKDPARLGQVVEDIIQKDIVKRYAIRKPNELRNVLKFLISNSGNRITFSGIAKNFGIKSPVTAGKYAFYAQEAYLLFIVSRFERKIKLLDKNPKKVYCIDNGMSLRLSAGLSKNLGFVLEGIVAVELKRRGEKFFYYVNKDGSETDFVLLGEREGGRKITGALQVCADVSDMNTMKREERALEKTLKEAGLKEGIVITIGHEGEKRVGTKKIRYIPAWKWLLG